MPKHEYYEELCALAAGDQLTEGEEREMQEHSKSCEECRTAFQEFRHLLNELPPLDETVDPVALRRAEEEGYRKRFLERARGQGRRFTDEAEQGIRSTAVARVPSLRALKWAMAAVCAMLVVSGLTYWGRQDAAKRNTAIHAGSAPLGAASSRPPKEELSPQFDELQDKIRTAEETNSLLEAENSALGRRLGVAEKDRDTALSQKAASDQGLAQATEARTQLEQQLARNATLLADARGELQRLGAEHSLTLASLLTEHRSVDDLSARLKAESESLDREKELLTAGRDVTDLMGARNLHVVDVYDGDGRGKNRKSFGRIFYTEGKSLIFYAFDLDERKLMNAQYTYKAWGERQASPTSIKGLGILYVDDKAQKRWALKVDDPQQLSEIDAVFVTLEPRDGGDTPHGQKLLFAFLGTSSNHP